MEEKIHHIDLEGMAKNRLEECRAEIEVAESFLRSGLIRNAAGKAFQAWRACLSYIAILNKDIFDFPGTKKVSGGVSIPRLEWNITMVPTNIMITIAQKLEDRLKGVLEITSMALLLHEYQYNGPDPTGVLSKTPSHDDARRMIEIVINEVRGLINQLMKAQ